MDYLAFDAVTIFMSIVNFFINIFLLFSVFFKQQRLRRLKQPLNVLLGTLLGCNITFQLCNCICSITDFFPLGFTDYVIIIEIALFTVRTSVTSSMWLNVFYFCQIVPAKRSFFIFLKKNIRGFIYSALIADKIFFLFELFSAIACSVIYVVPHENNLNTTYTQFDDIHNAKLNALLVISTVVMWLHCVYLSLCICIMLSSNCATILYLQKNLKCMKGSRSSLSPRLQRQMRVTITGIVQTFLSFLCLVWMIVEDALIYYLYSNGYIYGTVISIYSLGTTINLCIGQTVFRQRVVEIYHKCRQTLAFESA